MIEAQIRVYSNRKEGLLLELGKLVMENGFTLLRQRLSDGGDGEVSLTFTIRGSELRLLELEERLATHPLVRSYESIVREAALSATASSPAPVAQQREPLPAPNGQVHELATPVAAMPDAAPFDPAQIESMLPKLAQAYPRILPQLILFEQETPIQSRESALHYVGNRVGAWVYKRDYSLGARLTLHDAMRHIVVPAVRRLLPAEVDESGIHLESSPFCGRGHGRGRGGHFFCGFFEGLVNGGRLQSNVKVSESICRNSGAHSCTFVFEES